MAEYEHDRTARPCHQTQTRCYGMDRQKCPVHSPGTSGGGIPGQHVFQQYRRFPSMRALLVSAYPHVPSFHSPDRRNPPKGFRRSSLYPSACDHWLGNCPISQSLILQDHIGCPRAMRYGSIVHDQIHRIFRLRDNSPPFLYRVFSYHILHVSTCSPREARARHYQSRLRATRLFIKT